MIRSKIFQRLFVLMTLAIFVSCSTKQDQAEEQTSADSVAVAAPVSARPVHWGYDGEDGPANWASLSPVYALCGEGKGQSPINIVKSQAKSSATWSFDYKTTSLRIAHTEHMDDILDNGHTIQVTVDEGSTFTFGDKTYSLIQFHFHTPSEHMIDGKNLPMEMHLVHQSDDKSLAVVSVLFEEGKEENPNLAKMIANFPAAKGESNHITDVNLELKVNMPDHNEAFHYVGSLTTPPCSESVQWLVLGKFRKASAAQIKAFSDRIGPNNRPVQALNERAVESGDITQGSK
ncbi:MAG: carbonic anhydrase family protein [Flammeovirgaceae bacterium]|nr:carbonic anhydrase family protein [Flammeovirgaceae bacterium]